MTTLQGNGKMIQFAFNDVIHECSKNTYVVELPFIVCSNKKDAERIQQEIDNFVGKLGKKLIK